MRRWWHVSLLCAFLAGCGEKAINGAAPVANAARVEGPDLVVAKTGSTAEKVVAALEPYGGMGTFVKRGQTVVVKPNIGWARTPAS